MNDMQNNNMNAEPPEVTPAEVVEDTLETPVAVVEDQSPEAIDVASEAPDPTPESSDCVPGELTESTPESSDQAPESADRVREEGLETAPEEADEFAVLGLSEQVLEAVRHRGYTQPTQVQKKVIPHILEGRDVLAQSQTGSGKTAAFALPILSTLERKQRAVQTLVLAPTRELAIQVADMFESYAKQTGGFNILAIYGGQDYEQQFRALRRGVDVVVGTPGRVIDHIKRGTLDLSKVRCLVLDEADEMLNMGFLEDVEFVLQQTPENRQVTLFSATMPDPIREIADNYLVDPIRVRIKKKQMTAESIRQRAVIVPPKDKSFALMRFLEVEPTDGVIVFTKTKDGTVRLTEQLQRSGYSAIALNGDMPQKTRERAIDQLKAGKLDILVATDVAARGLDVSRISHVFNFDLPHDSESYIHRIGRTGRAGREGEAIIFLTPSQRRSLKLIEKATRKSIEVVSQPTADEVNALRIQRFKESISKTVADKDLRFFADLIAEHSTESGQPLEQIAAALAHLGQKGRPFLEKERPVYEERDDRRKQRGKEDRFGGKRSKFERGGDRGKSGRSFGPPESGMVRYRIEVGREDGVAPRNIVGAVANEAGIESRYIGPIKIFPHFSTIDLPEGLSKETLRILERAWVSGKQLSIRPDRGPRGSKGNGFKGGGAKGAKANGAKFKGKGFKKRPKPSNGKVSKKRKKKHSVAS